MDNQHKIALNAYKNGDYKTAYDIWVDESTKNNSQAMVNIGLMYLRGEGKPKDLTLAKEWFEKASIFNNCYALFNLSSMYQNGIGVVQDDAKAMELLKISAQYNHDVANFRLALHYLQDKTNIQNLKIGFDYIVKSASLNHMMSKVQLSGYDKNLSNTNKPTNEKFHTKSKDEKIEVIQDALTRYIKPMLKNDGGDVILVDIIEEEQLQIRLCYAGNCSGCSLGATTTYEMINKILNDIIDNSIKVYII